MMTTYKEYEFFLLGAVKRMEKHAHEQAQAQKIARIVDISNAERETTSHGQGDIVMAEVIDVEAENFMFLGAG